MSYLNSLSPEVLKRLTTEANSTWTDPATGMTYGAHWNQASAGNDENAATQATLTGGNIWGHSPNLMTEKQYKNGTTFDVPAYDPTTGAFTGVETGHYGGAKKDWADYMGMLMAAAVGAGGLYSAFMPGAFGGAGIGSGGAGAGAAGAAEGIGAGAGWAEMGAAEAALGQSALANAPIGAGLTAAGGSTAAGGGGSLLGSLGSGLMQYAPGLLSGIASGFSKDPSQQARELDPRVASAIYGDGNNKGALNFAQGLLNTPVAPNGFARFYPKG
jgi:hypothetical protein